MADRNVDDPAHVTDNGVRSFIPPTFCFELRSRQGNLIATVSRVLLIDDGGLRTDSDAVAELQRAELLAVGIIEVYDAGPQARSAGEQFTVLRTIEQ